MMPLRLFRLAASLQQELPDGGTEFLAAMKRGGAHIPHSETVSIYNSGTAKRYLCRHGRRETMPEKGSEMNDMNDDVSRREELLQALVEADFLVNLFEGNSPEQAIVSAKEKIFRTATGKALLETMFGV